MMLTKNNVHVSGNFLEEECLSPNTVKLTVGVQTSDILLPVTILADSQAWQNFKEAFPENYNSITISGKLQATRNEGGGFNYLIKANSICCFHNILQDSLDESETTFNGIVMLKKKYDFDTASKLYLKRMIFETVEEDSRKNVVFEAMALRGAAPYFDEIQEGDTMLLKANYVLDRNGNPPYWRIKHRPELAR